MSSYYPRECSEHGEWLMDIEGPYECEECLKEGKTPLQKAEATIARVGEFYNQINVDANLGFDHGVRFYRDKLQQALKP